VNSVLYKSSVKFSWRKPSSHGLSKAFSALDKCHLYTSPQSLPRRPGLNTTPLLALRQEQWMGSTSIKPSSAL